MKADDIFKIFDAHRAELTEFGVHDLAIFGSVARETAIESSDVDILVEFSRPIGLFEFVRLELTLEGWIGHPIDLVTPDALHPALRDRILKEAIHTRNTPQKDYK